MQSTVTKVPQIPAVPITTQLSNVTLVVWEEVIKEIVAYI